MSSSQELPTQQEPPKQEELSRDKSCKWSWVIPIYIFLYTLGAIWLLIDGWLTGFTFVLKFWDVPNDHIVSPLVLYSFFTMIGAILGCALLGIISFHRYQAIEKSFDSDHLWGFFLTPILALIVGILTFAIIQSGLVVLSGDLASATNPENASLGYLAIGGVAGYNWDVVANKIQNLSKSVLNADREDK